MEMDKTRDALKSYRALENYWPPTIPRTSIFTKTRGAWPAVSAPPTLLPNRMLRHRRSHHATMHQSTGFVQHNGGTSIASDSRTYHLQRQERQFSEDSGFSSCGSSASSVADDLETFSGSTSYGPPTYLKPRHSYHRSSSTSSRNCRLHSDTVASVLAAGISDSEETGCESEDEGSDGVFSHLPVTGNNKEKSRFPSAENCIVSSVRQILQRVTEIKDSSLLEHCGRNILDLGTNLTTHFPLKASELPEKNLPLFLQNRSQYHRLGKFGANEKLCFANCTKQCGFAFPVPPNESVFIEKKL